MSDKQNMHDEEYQFPHDESYDDLQPIKLEEEAAAALPLEEEESRSTGLRAVWEEHKRIILIVSAVILVAVVFTIFRTIQHKQENVPTAIPEQTVVTPAAQPIVDPQLNDQVNGLKQDSINNTVAIRQLQRQVQQLDASLNQSRASQQQLNQSLMTLVNQVQQLTAEVKAAHAPKPAKAEPVKVKPAEPPITFQLRAVVPGRAWVVGSDGQSLSVAVGDSIPQYGSVQNINADEGVVLTTSGKTIRFSP